MNGNQLFEWGFWGWVIYALLKGLNSSGASSDYSNTNQIPQSPTSFFTPEEIDRMVAEIQENLESPQPSSIESSSLSDLEPVKPSPAPQTIEAQNWLRLIRHPSIVIILGGRGKGKSCLGYRLLEHLRWVASAYVVGLPESARKLLPDYIGMVVSLEDVPPNSIVLVDEGYLTYHARRSMAATSVQMSQILNLSRQRNQTLIFVTQEAVQIDRNIASSANVIIFKDLGMLQLEFDRRQLSKIATKAEDAFATIITGDKRKQAYVYAPDSEFMGLVENSLPAFWCEKLSHIFAAGGEIIAIAPKKTPLSERIERAKELKRQGLSNGKIAIMMGVSKGTIKNYLEGYPYKG